MQIQMRKVKLLRTPSEKKCQIWKVSRYGRKINRLDKLFLIKIITLSDTALARYAHAWGIRPDVKFSLGISDANN